MNPVGLRVRVDNRPLRVIGVMESQPEMFGESNTLLYVGKARNLRKRLTSYFKKDLTGKTASLI